MLTKNRYINIILIILFGFLLISITVKAESAIIKVGFYENKPLMFKEDGQIKGFYIDLLNFISQAEGWDIRYVEIIPENALYEIKIDKINLFFTATFLDQQDNLVNYTKENIFLDWGRIYSSKSNLQSIKTLLDLNKKDIGVLKGDRHYSGEGGFKNRLNQFNVKADFIEYETVEEIFKDLEIGKIEAGVVNRTSGALKSHAYNIVSTPIIFNPVEIKVIGSLGETGQIIETIDHYLKQWKNDSSSYYLQRLNYWLVQNVNKGLPGYLLETIALLFSSLMLVLIIFFFFKNQIKNVDDMAKELKEANEQLKQSQKMFKLNFEESKIGMAIEDINGNFLNVNNTFAELLGYTKEELLQKGVKDITHQDDLEMSLCTMRESLKDTSKSRNFEKRYIHKNGRIVWINLHGNVACDEDGKPLYLLVQIEDITEKKEAEKKILQQQKEIEHHKLKTRFFANISHEFKTPLNLIFSALQTYDFYSNKKNGERYNNKFNKYLSIIKQNSYRLLRLVNNMVDVTKIETNSFGLKMQNIDIVKVVEKIVLSLEDYLINKGRVLDFHSEIKEKVIAADPFEIERILMNLLSNAVKFTNMGDLIAVNIYEENQIVHISVQDTGIGIKEEDQEVIFQEFRQVDKSFTRSHEGSGLGLSIVKSLVELHGGEISLSSQYGLGSEFVIKLPVKTLSGEELSDSLNSSYYEDNIDRIKVELSDIYDL